MSKNIFDNNLFLASPEINLSTYNFMLTEIAQYFIKQKDNLDVDLELQELGKKIGIKFYELICLRENKKKKENNQLEIVKFIHSIVWKHLFGKTADSLTKSKGSGKYNNSKLQLQIEVEYQIQDKNFPLISCETEDYSFSLASIMVGILQNMIEQAGFQNKVNWHKEQITHNEVVVTFIIEFDEI